MISMVDYIVIGVVILTVGVAAFYIIRKKKSGAKCIGCPDAKSCSGNCSGCSRSYGCH